MGTTLLRRRCRIVVAQPSCRLPSCSRPGSAIGLRDRPLATVVVAVGMARLE
ncbi:hypothetical protein BTZ20_5735 [Rhodococcus sp. MTM3W5.2]|nr:hypothetical protein BTZ20_5735 [Rhodococcus sp. MTM3W5.2]